jgi:hypothetical protein
MKVAVSRLIFGAFWGFEARKKGEKVCFEQFAKRTQY